MKKVILILLAVMFLGAESTWMVWRKQVDHRLNRLEKSEFLGFSPEEIEMIYQQRLQGPVGETYDYTTGESGGPPLTARP